MPRAITLGLLVLAVCAELSPAQRRSTQADANRNALIAAIPFADDAGTSIFLPVGLNGGKPGWWVLDSGASECIVDRNAAQNAHLRTRGTRELRGAGKGSVRLDSIRTSVNLEVGGRRLPTCEHFAAVD